MFRRLKFLVPAIVGVTFLASQAEAAILCEGNFQILSGTAISTPYCQDENLAAVERKQGIGVSGEAVRRSPDAKRQACTNASTTNETACADYLGD